MSKAETRRSPPSTRRRAIGRPLMGALASCYCVSTAISGNIAADDPSASTARWPTSPSILPTAHAFATTTVLPSAASGAFDTTRLFSLKPAAIPLMDSGKALARSGELLIDLTSALDLYGGSLSAVGANVRNCGDCLAQAAASCRFKTAAELVIDELREGAECLREGGDKLSRAVAESEVDEEYELMGRIGEMIEPTKRAAACLEEAGAAIMQRESVEAVGRHLVSCGEALEALSSRVGALDPGKEEGKSSSQRMMYASQQMIVAGKELAGEKKEKPKGKSWIKG